MKLLINNEAVVKVGTAARRRPGLPPADTWSAKEARPWLGLD